MRFISSSTFPGVGVLLLLATGALATPPLPASSSPASETTPSQQSQDVQGRPVEVWRRAGGATALLPGTGTGGKFNATTMNRRMRLQRENSAELVRRDGTKYVFMHHIVGNTYPYTSDNWLADMRDIAAKGVDAIALNIGSSDWQRNQVDMAYAAAQASGTGIKLFYSFDFTEMPCDVDDLVARVQRYSSHPNQFKINGKVFIGSFSGDCLGDSGWGTLKQRTNAYLMPFIWGLEGRFDQWPSLDSWQCWGCAWPQGNYPKNTIDDNFYINQLGTRYAATVSCWFYTHLSYKNIYMRGDDWLAINRWEQLMAMRDTVTFVEMATWNDWGEASYYGPIRGAQPAGTNYVDGFPHTAWYDMSEYYIRAFKTGSYPAITKSAIYFWARPHPAQASASGDGLGKPTGFDWTEDTMWAAVFVPSAATVTLSCGSSTQTFNVNPGVNKLKIPLAPGKMSVKMVRNGQTIIDYTPSDYTYVTNPVTYNYNAWVGSATASNEGTSGSSSSSSSASSTSSSTSTSSSSSSSATPTSTTWSVYGCVAEGTTGSRRALTGLSTSQAGMTYAICQNFCAGYNYAGVEYGNECHCGNTLANNGATGALISDDNCPMACGGDSSKKCGGDWTLTVFTNIPSSAPTSSPTPTTSGWSTYGCVAEGTTGSRRALAGPSTTQAAMTYNTCQNFCTGYNYAGIDYGTECYCGNTLTNNGATGALVSNDNCYMPCGGDSSKKCGGDWTLTVFTNIPSSAPTSSPTPTTSGWSTYGCVAEGTTGSRRALAGPSTTQAAMTYNTCQTFCAGYNYAGIDYGTECYCGNTLTNNGATGALISDDTCSMPCGGDSSKKCGGVWTMTVFTQIATSTQWNSAGCYYDSSNKRMLRGMGTAGIAGLTTEQCIASCATAGYTMAGTEYSNECYCGSQIFTEDGSGAQSTGCTMPCSGNSAQICGGGNRLNLYLKPGTTL